MTSLQKIAVVLVLGLAALTSFPASSSARTWYIKVDGTGDKPTIQAAIVASVNGDTVLVAPGHYTWANQGGGASDGMLVVRRYLRITLASESGPGVTKLDAQGQGRVLFIAADNYMTVDGFTITGGEAPATGYPSGGGITTHLSHDMIRNCVFEYNHASWGGAIWVGGVSTPTIEDCLFRNNSAEFGGALFFINSLTKATVRNCVIRNNTANVGGGGIYITNDGPDLENNIIAFNEAGSYGGGVGMRTIIPMKISNCTVAYNRAPIGGALYFFMQADVTVENTILSHSTLGSALAVDVGTAGTTTISCSDIYGNGGGNTLPPFVIDLGDNFSKDPKYCGAYSFNFTLSGDSPCAAGNHPGSATCGLIGAKGPACGLTPVTRRTWGGIKALYR